MLHRIISFVVILSLAIHSLGRFGMLVNYQLNKESITSRFCVNKARPQLRCQGKCYLAKQLKAQQEHEQKLPLQSKDSQEIVFFAASSFQFNRLPTYAHPLAGQFCYLLIPYKTPGFGIDHPPQS